MKRGFVIFFILAFCGIQMGCPILDFLGLGKDDLPDIEGWWMLTVQFIECQCLQKETATTPAVYFDCPDSITQGIDMPSTKQLKVEFIIYNETEDLKAVFYDNNVFLFEMYGYLEGSDEFRVSLIQGDLEFFFDGSIDGDSMEGRTELNNDQAASVSCSGYGTFAGTRL
jgi:hypothetical protein